MFWIVSKLDVEKVYWSFLQYMMVRMWFGKIEWIYSCVSLAHFSVLINGSPEGFFKSSKGLRQGDPISLPFQKIKEKWRSHISDAFCYCCRSFACIMERAKQVRLIDSFAIENVDCEVTHLQFAYDTIIFCEALVGQWILLSTF